MKIGESGTTENKLSLCLTALTEAGLLTRVAAGRETHYVLSNAGLVRGKCVILPPTTKPTG